MGPGGKRERRESYRTCVIRETQEELGVLLSKKDVQHVAEFISYLEGRPMFRVRVFVATRFRGTIRETETFAARWWHRSAIPHDHMLATDKTWMRRAMRKERFFAHLYFGNDWRDLKKIQFFRSRH